MKNEWTQDEIQEEYNNRKDEEYKLRDELRLLEIEMQKGVWDISYIRCDDFLFGRNPILRGLKAQAEIQKRINQINDQLAYLLDNKALIEKWGEEIAIAMRCVFPRMRYDTKIDFVPRVDWLIPILESDPIVYYEVPGISFNDTQMYEQVELKSYVFCGRRLEIDFSEKLNTLYTLEQAR